MAVTLDKWSYLHHKREEEIEGAGIDADLIMLISAAVKSSLFIAAHNRPSKYSTGVPGLKWLQCARERIYYVNAF